MAARWGVVYLAENTRRLAYHVTAPRWNLRAPPTTGSERRGWVIFHTKNRYRVVCASHSRGFAVAILPQGKFITVIINVTVSSSFLLETVFTPETAGQEENGEGRGRS
jgi:hypothetical protein